MAIGRFRLVCFHLQSPVLASPHDPLGTAWLTRSLDKQFVNVSFAIGDAHHPRLRMLSRYLLCLT